MDDETRSTKLIDAIRTAVEKLPAELRAAGLTLVNVFANTEPGLAAIEVEALRRKEVAWLKDGIKEIVLELRRRYPFYLHDDLRLRASELNNQRIQAERQFLGQWAQYYSTDAEALRLAYNAREQKLGSAHSVYRRRVGGLVKRLAKPREDFDAVAQVHAADIGKLAELQSLYVVEIMTIKQQFYVLCAGAIPEDRFFPAFWLAQRTWQSYFGFSAVQTFERACHRDKTS
jgi:hypothetical protein